MIQIKLDENFSPYTADIFKNAGFDTHTVYDESLSGADDTVIYNTCLAEKRCIITFDTDFCDILRFPSEPTEGIIVIRPKRPISLQDVKMFATKIVELLKDKNPQNSLWILDFNKLRIRKMP